LTRDDTILIVGGGGREHALAWKIAQSPRVARVYVAPGNGGTALEPGVENVDISATDIAGLVEFAKQAGVSLTIVGPEAPLVAGIVDSFQSAGLRCFGPGRDAARLEGSKAFAKAFMAKYGIPTAAYRSFTDLDTALGYVREIGAPVVIKADGLAAGKGVILAEDLPMAEAALRDMLGEGVFGAAGSTVVVEEWLRGEETSYIALIDGEHILPLASSKDHKARDDGGLGPNTGGMGAFSPAPLVTPGLEARILREVMEPTLRGLAAEGLPYTGFLYAGLMIADDGSPRVLEYNCRLGDPETQPILMRLESDLLDLIEAALVGDLDRAEARWAGQVALGVVLAAGGYPGTYQRGLPIRLVSDVGTPQTKVFHAGTRLADGELVSAGGRVLCATSLADDIEAARAHAYQALRAIDLENAFYRTDIGQPGANPERA
jgi:phosphoribosylamine--glycine ligase